MIAEDELCQLLNPYLRPNPYWLMADPIIETQGLTKTYGTMRALNNVTVSIPPGTIGLLGPNGAGKTTFLKCLLNLETPSAGGAQVLGRNIRSSNRESRERVGYGPEQDCHIPGLAGCEYVTYCGQLPGMSFRAARPMSHRMSVARHDRLLDVVIGAGVQRRALHADPLHDALHEVIGTEFRVGAVIAHREFSSPARAWLARPGPDSGSPCRNRH